MVLRIAWQVALGVLAASTAAAQDTLGPAPGRVFVLRQVSWWAADGLPASEVVAQETTFVFRPDSARGWPSSGMVPAAFELDPGSSLNVTLAVGLHSGIEAVLVSAEEARCGQEWADGPSSTLAALALSLLVPVDSIGEEARPLPTLTFGACDDTVVTTFGRSVHRYAAPERAGFLTLRGAVGAVWAIERRLESGGATARASLSGSIFGRVRVGAGGVADSLDLSGRFRGRIAYLGPGARADTVYGTWVVELRGGWQEDPRIQADRAFEFFARHGRAMGGEVAEGPPANPYLALARAADTNAAVDSLVTLRIRATDPQTRAHLEVALEEARWAAPQRLRAALLAAPIRIAPSLLFADLRYGTNPRDTTPFGRDVAAFLIRELAPLAVQRRRLTDREDLGAAVLGVLGDGRGFVPDAGPPLAAAAAARADDPLSRDLLLFAAYQADPARYRATVESTVDSLRGYGPIVRAWLAGDGNRTNWSWGVGPERRDSVVRFPGAHASPERLTEYFVGRSRLAPLRMRFASEGRDLGAELRGRFATDTTYAARKIVARYLEGLGDTTARPWLRTLLRAAPELRDVAYWLLPRDTVRDTTLIADVQRLVLGYVAGLEPVPDTAGVPVPEPWVHDERPDLRILASDGVLPSAIEPWQRQFLVMTMDSVEARVASDGLQMAWVVSPVLRAGDRVYVSVTLVPVGAPCLCGGGVNFTLERRDGRWVAVAVDSWIS